MSILKFETMCFLLSAREVLDDVPQNGYRSLTRLYRYIPECESLARARLTPGRPIRDSGGADPLPIKVKDDLLHFKLMVKGQTKIS